LLLFGGEALGEALKTTNVTVEQHLIPQSEKRFLFFATDEHGFNPDLSV
jgi:hypothetical protein